MKGRSRGEGYFYVALCWAGYTTWGGEILQQPDMVGYLRAW